MANTLQTFLIIAVIFKNYYSLPHAYRYDIYSEEQQMLGMFYVVEKVSRQPDTGKCVENILQKKSEGYHLLSLISYCPLFKICSLLNCRQHEHLNMGLSPVHVHIPRAYHSVRDVESCNKCVLRKDIMSTESRPSVMAAGN
jgi:hypothetical protein